LPIAKDAAAGDALSIGDELKLIDVEKPEVRRYRRRQSV
jgi:hypothetical protein